MRIASQKHFDANNIEKQIEIKYSWTLTNSFTLRLNKKLEKILSAQGHKKPTKRHRHYYCPEDSLSLHRKAKSNAPE